MWSETAILFVENSPGGPIKFNGIFVSQTVDNIFDTAGHAMALFKPIASRLRYSHINDATGSVLEQRIAAFDGEIGSLWVSSREATLHRAFEYV